jgi:hypothetical protein
LANEPLAVIDQQPQIELGPGQMRDREGRKALLHRDARNAQRVDRIGLAVVWSRPAATGALRNRQSPPQAAPISAQPVHLAAGDRKVADRSTGRPLAEVSAVRRVPDDAPQAAQLERCP